MAIYLKRGREPEAIRAAGEEVSETVRGILADLVVDALMSRGLSQRRCASGQQHEEEGCCVQRLS